MAPVVTRSSSAVGSDSHSYNSEGEKKKSKSKRSLRKTRSGRVSKKRKKSMSKRDSDRASPNLDDSVQSLSLDDSHGSQEACSSGVYAAYPQQSKVDIDKTADLPSSSEVEKTTAKESSSQSKSSKSEKPECSICIQPALQPVKLPCNHIFCFLCIKGAVHNGTNSCALCRAPLPRNYIFNPDLLSETSESSEDNSAEDTEPADKWYYEGRNGGWWEFDPRTADQIEERFNRPADGNPRTLELMIAGFIYIIDLDNMCQKRKDNPHVMRRLKRDREVADKKGVAGIVKGNQRRPNRSRNTVV